MLPSSRRKREQESTDTVRKDDEQVASPILTKIRRKE
jgi:hypothetical protein